MKRAFAAGKTLPTTKRAQTFDSALLEILGEDEPPKKEDKMEVVESVGVSTRARPAGVDLEELESRIRVLKLDPEEEKRLMQPLEIGNLKLEVKYLDERQRFITLRNWNFAPKLPLISNINTMIPNAVEELLIEKKQRIEIDEPLNTTFKFFIIPRKLKQDAATNMPENYFQTEIPFADLEEKLPKFCFSEYVGMRKLIGSLPLQLTFWTIEHLLLLKLVEKAGVDFVPYAQQLMKAAYSVCDIPEGDVKLPLKEGVENPGVYLTEFVFIAQQMQQTLVDDFVSASKSSLSPVDRALFDSIRGETIAAEEEYRNVLKDLSGRFKTIDKELTDAGTVTENVSTALSKTDKALLDLKNTFLPLVVTTQREKVELQRRLNDLARELDKARRSQPASAGGRMDNGKKDTDKLNASAAKIQRETILSQEINLRLNELRIFRYLRLVSGYLVRRNVQSLMYVNLEDVVFQRVMLRSEINSENDIFFTSHLPGNLEKVKEDVKRIVNEEIELYRGIFEHDRTDFYKAGNMVMTPDALAGRERAWSYLKTIIQLGNSPNGSNKVQVKLNGQYSMEFIMTESIPELLDAFAQLTAANMTHLAEIQKMRATTKSDKIDIGMYMYGARERMRHVLRFHCGIMVRETDTADFIAEQTYF